MNSALWLFERAGQRYAALLASRGARWPGENPPVRLDLAAVGAVAGRARRRAGKGNGTLVEGESPDAFARDFFRVFEQAIEAGGTYRGKILSLESSEHFRGESVAVKVHRMAPVAREQVILPAATLALLERNVLRFVEQRTKLRAAGLSAKKGLLFYGPPGTGKTHTIRYLAGALRGHTTFLITAEQVGLLDQYISLARLLQPSVLVLEDADLIGRERSHRAGPCDEALLNQLLNEMDGLREDAEVLFLLTTNRPEHLEPALAARPGRVDQAIEFPLPDDAGRRKLVVLYAGSLNLDEQLLGHVVGRTEGVSAAFIKELMRRAMQFHIERDGGGALSAADVDAAIEEMLFTGGRLNRMLLGATAAEAGPAGGS